MVQRAGGLVMASRCAPGAAAPRPVGFILRRVEHEHRGGCWIVVQRAGGLVTAEGMMMAPLAPLHPDLCGLLCALMVYSAPRGGTQTMGRPAGS